MMFWQELRSVLAGRLFTPEALATFAIKAAQVAAVIVLAWLLSWLVRRMLNRMMHGRSRLTQKSSARTAMTVLRSLVYYVFFFGALVTILRIIGVDFAAILAGAGVAGIALGFGAQALVRDFLAGFFLLFEDAVNVGDIIVAGDIQGTVEQIGIRRTQVRSYDGTLHTIPNGQLTIFGNKTREWMRAIAMVDLAYEQDPERGMQIAQKVADRWYAEHSDIALAPPEVHGLLSLGDSGVTIRVVVTVRPPHNWGVERELRLMLKKTFDAEGVEIPFPRRVVYNREDKA